MNDLLSLLITWEITVPLTCFLIAILFKKPFSNLINKLEKIKIKEWTFKSNNQESNSESNSEIVQNLLDRMGNSGLIQDQEERICAELKEKKLDTSGDTTKVLIRHLAGTQILLTFEQIHALIFGSQIRLLEKLNECVNTGGMSSEYIEEYFLSVKEFNPRTILDKWDSKEYLRFLFDYTLIMQKENQYHITQLGHEYLVWIPRASKFKDKWL